MAILETKLIGIPASGSTTVPAVGIAAHVILVQNGTHPRARLHPHHSRLAVFGLKYTPEPTPISEAQSAIHPAFWLQAYPESGQIWVALSRISVGQTIRAILVGVVSPWEKVAHPTLPNQKDPVSVLSGRIWDPPTSNITTPGYPPPVKLVPPSPLQPLLNGNLPFSENEGFERAKIVHPINQTRIRAKNILPFIKYGIY